MKTQVLTTLSIALFLQLSLLAFQPVFALQINGKIKTDGPKYIGVYRYYYFRPEPVAEGLSQADGSFSITVPDAYAKGVYGIGIRPGTEKEFDAKNLKFDIGVVRLEGKNVAIDIDKSAPFSQRLKGSAALPDLMKLDSVMSVMEENIQNWLVAYDKKPSQDYTPAAIERKRQGQAKGLDSLNAIRTDYLKSLTKTGNKEIKKVAEGLLDYRKTKAKDYFKKEDFTDPVLSSQMLLDIKLNLYLYSNDFGEVSDYYSIFRDIIAIAPKGSPGRINVVSKAIRTFGQSQDVDLLRTLLTAWLEENPKNDWATKQLASLPKGMQAIGTQAPDIAMESPDGKTLKLSDLKGKVVLLDFWASWCGPCRKENPNVVSAYAEFGPKGFTVFSVSLDQNREAWLRAIQTDKLTWPDHVSDLAGWSNAAAKEYGVRSIPATFLINKEGVIVAKNLRGQALDEELAKLLK